MDPISKAILRAQRAYQKEEKKGQNWNNSIKNNALRRKKSGTKRHTDMKKIARDNQKGGVR